jgi:hypothetical protein
MNYYAKRQRIMVNIWKAALWLQLCVPLSK